MTDYPRRRPRPVAACVRCGRVHDAAPDRTAICERPEGTGICGGRITWTGGRDDWTECTACAATGVVDGADCATCKGDGWMMGRGR